MFSQPSSANGLEQVHTVRPLANPDALLTPHTRPNKHSSLRGRKPDAYLPALCAQFPSRFAFRRL